MLTTRRFSLLRLDQTECPMWYKKRRMRREELLPPTITHTMLADADRSTLLFWPVRSVGCSGIVDMASVLQTVVKKKEEKIDTETRD